MLRHLVLLSTLCISKTLSTDVNYRLNTTFVPESYDITITPYFDTNDERAFTFDGVVKITFRTESATSQIKLHSQDLNYTSSNIIVQTTGNQSVPLATASPLEFDTNYTFAYINLQSNLAVNVNYTIEISYRGLIRKDLSGFYRNYYIENGVKKWLGATQMEPTHARMVFPCFDEPQLKAVFTLNIDRPASYRPTLANTKLMTNVTLANGYVRETFYPTPRMSTYLVAFLVSEFEAAKYHVNGSREFGIITRPEARNQSDYAFDVGMRIVDALSAYFGIDYYSVDANLKLDHVALPDFRAGAMENWGLIKYRESLLLYVPEESTPYFKYRVAQIIAHETTHMWFGDLVTCHWWSNTWLNEGFANYFQDYITSLIEPDVGSADLLVTGSVYSAYDADDSSDSVPISNSEVNSPAEISAHFGTITYQKAGSVIRMMHHLLGDQAFILGLNLYLNVNRFQSGYPELMYTALEEAVTVTGGLSAYPGATVADIMGSWISRAGHPVLNVYISYETDEVVLTQKRFYSDNSIKSDEIYKIPITYTTEISMNFANTKPEFIMETRNHTFTINNISNDHSWVIFNIQETGLYRVNYDDNSWSHILSALKGEQRDKIHHLNRAKIINDAFALYFAGETNFKRIHDVLDILAEETDYSVWNAAVRGLKKLRNYFIGTNDLATIDNYISQVLQYGITKMGYDVISSEGTVALQNRMQVLDLACKAGHSGCIENTVKLFKAFRDDDVKISPSLRPVAYCYGLRNGVEEDYEFLWRRMATTNVANEAWVIAQNLGCTPHTTKLQKYLVSMEEEESPIRIQDLTVPLNSVLSVYENVALVLDELQQNYDHWSKIYPSMETVISAVASALHTEDEFQKFESWLNSCSACSEEVKTNGRKSLTEAKAVAAWATTHRDEIINSLKSSALIAAPSFVLLLAALFAIYELKI